MTVNDGLYDSENEENKLVMMKVRSAIIYYHGLYRMGTIGPLILYIAYQLGTSKKEMMGWFFWAITASALTLMLI